MHKYYTGSARADAVLQAWDKYRPNFVKVMPVEYRRALQKCQQQHKHQNFGIKKQDLIGG